MIKRTIEVSGADTALSVRDDQLLVRRDGQVVGQAPIEDIGVLIIDTPTATYTHASLVRLLHYGGVAVLCGPKHVPVSIVAPIEANAVLAERLRLQVEASLPVRKRVWQEIVRAKIARQAEVVEDGQCAARLRALAQRVKSGDPQNVEAQAARLYWASWLGPGEPFRRARDGAPPNNLLNYGYMAVRAAVARAVCGSGLHPALGLKHTNRYNAFSLADDLVEPFRALVDWRVRALWRAGTAEVTREAKEALLGLLRHSCETDGQTGPLLVALETMTASLVRRFAGEETRLRIPRILWNGANGEPCGSS